MPKPTTNNLAIAILISSVIIAIAIILNPLIAKLSPKPPDPQKIYQNVSYVKTTGSPYIGKPNAPITIIEYMDFECPFCRAVYQDIMPQLKTEYIDTGIAKLVFKNKPYKEIHKTAFKKSEAAFCAYDQGGNQAFIKFHDQLFNTFSTPQENELNQELQSIASQQNLNPTKFNNCLETGKYKPHIEKDIVESIAIQAEGTPVWLIGKTQNDKLIETVKIPGAHTYEIYKTIIDQLLAT